MDLQKIQDEQREWQERNFPGSTSTDVLLGVVEEVGELTHSHLKGKQGIRHAPKEIAAMKKDAVGDVVVYLMAYCNLEGLSLQECIEEVWAQVRRRDWKADSKAGCKE